MPIKVPKQQLSKADRRSKAMEADRSTFIGLWGDLTRHFLVHRGRYDLSDINDGKRRDNELFNNTPLLARRVLSAGLMSGMTSPARKWFRLTTGDLMLDKDYDVRDWLHACTQTMYGVFALSNLYNSLQTYYNEIGTFGTAAMGVFEDDEKHIRFETQTAGQYALGIGRYGDVNAFTSRRNRQVRELVEEYGYDNCPRIVRTMWDREMYTQTVTVVKLVEPNQKAVIGSPWAWDKRWSSLTWVEGTSDSEQPLQIGGYDSFPYMAARWDLSPGDIYGTDSPAMNALGDSKSLQVAEKDILTVMDRVARPPYKADVSLRKVLGDNSPQPGRTYYVDNMQAGVIPLDTTAPSLTYFETQVRRYEDRINKAFYVDLFRMMMDVDRREITAREVAERHEEKLLQLGPVLERLHNEVLDPLIDRAFAILERKGLFPDPPEILQGRELRIEYVSVMAQAQRLASMQGIERVAGFVMQMTQLDPTVAAKFNAQAAVEHLAEIAGAEPDILRSDEEVEEIMQAQQQQQEEQEARDRLPEMAQAAKTASETRPTDGSVLKDLMEQAGAGL